MHPIVITSADQNGYYSIIAGRRRFEAFKKLKDKKDDGFILCHIVTDKNEIRKQKIITLAENATGKRLIDEEQISGIVEIFKEFGFSDPNEIKHYAKSHHNAPDSEKIPQDFREALASIPYAPNTIYQLMQLITDLKPSILRYAENMNLSTAKKVMLTHTKLRTHPQLQKELIDRIKTMKDEDARLEVDQMIQDIANGGITREGNSYRYNESVREKLEVRPTKHYLNLLRNMHKMLFALTGHKINKGEYRYFEETVTYSKDHRRQMLDELNDLAIVALDRDMRIVKLAVDNMLELIQTKVLTSSSEEQHQTK